MSRFIFNKHVIIEAFHKAAVPACIKREEALLEAISIALRFPEYFGKNWNALVECICDLSWLPPGDVMLTHEDLPLSEDRASLSIYLWILWDAVEKWKTTGSNLIFVSPEKFDASGERALLVKRKLLIVFPPDTENAILGLLAEAQNTSGAGE